MRVAHILVLLVAALFLYGCAEPLLGCSGDHCKKTSDVDNDLPDPDEMNEHERYVYQNMGFTWTCRMGCSTETHSGGNAPYEATFSAVDLGEHVDHPGSYVWDFDGVPDLQGDLRAGLSVDYRFDEPGDKLVFLFVTAKGSERPFRTSEKLVISTAPLDGEKVAEIFPEFQGSVCEVNLIIRKDEDDPKKLILHGSVRWLQDGVQLQVGEVFFTEGVSGNREYYWRYDPTNTDPAQEEIIRFRAGTTTHLQPYTLERSGNTLKVLVVGAQCFTSQNRNPEVLDFGYPAAHSFNIE